MRGALFLAQRALAHHPLRSALLVFGVALTVFLPRAVQRLVVRYDVSLRARAAATPLVLGAPGSRYDLVLGALYFRGRSSAPITIDDARALGADGLATVVPLFRGVRAELAAGGAPLVGVGHEYYAFRGLTPALGALPLTLGECVLGARAAVALGCRPGDALLTDRAGLYDLGGGYPLKLTVAGVLAPSGGPDDDAVLCDVKTAWIAAGVGHGHASAAEESGENVIARTEEGGTVLSPALVEYQEIGEKNADSFHFHGGPDALPLSAAIVLPRDAKARTLLKGRYRVRSDLLLAEPSEVMGELLGFVLRAKAFFDANSLASVAAALCFFGVIVALSLALRARERATLAKIGIGRGALAAIFACEFAFVLLLGVVLAELAARVFVARAAAAWLGG